MQAGNYGIWSTMHLKDFQNGLENNSMLKKKLKIENK